MPNTIITIVGRRIDPAAILESWPGAEVSTTYPGGNTKIIWYGFSSVPVKTEAEIIAAQDAFDAGDPDEREVGRSPLFNDPVSSAMVDVIVGRLSPPMTRAAFEAAILAALKAGRS